MSAAVQPYSKAARGRLPMRPWVRVVIVGVIVVGVAFVITWVFVMPGGQKPAASSSAMWSAGRPLTLPTQSDTAAPVPAQPSPSSSDAGSSIPGPPPAQLIQPMRMWGGAGGETVAAIPRRRPIASNERADGAGEETPTANHATEAEVDKDISLLLPEGTTFGCLPLSPIDTQLVGSLTCTADEEVWSADGTNRLIDKGAFISGEIQRGLGLGQDRAFILWHRVRSTRVRAVLDSPGVDELGQMGAPGVLQEHLWQKIKATVLLTGVEGLSQAGQNLAERGNGNSYVNLSNGQSLAQTALQHDINIPTTLWRGQAWPLRIRVEHDVWFRRAYGDVLVAGAIR